MKFVHFSTNAVYDGDNAPYRETSECNPINYYGVIKLKADNFLISEEDDRVIVARPITMYGKKQENGRANPASMIVDSLVENKKLNLVNDVLVNILYIGDLVKVVDKLIRKNFSGLINISGDVVYSRYDLGLEYASLLNKDAALINEVSSAEFKTVAKRPLNTSFDNSLMKEIGVNPSSLKDNISELL